MSFIGENSAVATCVCSIIFLHDTIHPALPKVPEFNFFRRQHLISRFQRMLLRSLFLTLQQGDALLFLVR